MVSLIMVRSFNCFDHRLIRRMVGECKVAPQTTPAFRSRKVLWQNHFHFQEIFILADGGNVEGTARVFVTVSDSLITVGSM